MTTTAQSSTPYLTNDAPEFGNCFVAVYPPFSVWSHEGLQEFQDTLQHVRAEPLGIYVHLPFCPQKCDYCYYLSYTKQPAEVVDRYLDHLIEELRIYAQYPAVQSRPVKFVYIGGGTPSTLSSKQLERLIDSFSKILPWSDIKEITFECAPRSVRTEFLTTMRRLGVTRVSMGVQSFDNALLKVNGRVHAAEDVVTAFNRIQEVGFPTVNLDLMCGLLGETEDQWEASVDRMIQLSPDSVTLYQTEIPFNTTLYAKLKDREKTESILSWNHKRARLSYGFTQLEKAGYTVVSAYQAVKNPDQHPFHYQDNLWYGKDMLGLGVAAFGFLNGTHLQNEVTLGTYQKAIDNADLPVRRVYRLSPQEQATREFVLQLKTGTVEIDHFHEQFDISIDQVMSKPLQQLSAAGFLTVGKERIELSRRGLLQVDHLLPEFYLPKHRNRRYT